MNPELRHNPIVMQELEREQRRIQQRSMHLMLQRPACSGCITLLQNIVELNSVGNHDGQPRFTTIPARRRSVTLPKPATPPSAWQGSRTANPQRDGRKTETKKKIRSNPEFQDKMDIPLLHTCTGAYFNLIIVNKILWERKKIYRIT